MSVVWRSVSTYYPHHSFVMWAGVIFLSCGQGIQLTEGKWCVITHYVVCAMCATQCVI